MWANGVQLYSRGECPFNGGFDTIRRYFEYRGYEVAYISNFTDVDDKIINRAKEEGITPQEVADKYIAAFREDVTALGVKPATRHPRVSGVYG